LERQVEERTASLKESNNLLHESNNNLDQFATIASHDLQEPLRKIRLFSALLRQRHDNVIIGEARELIDKISRSAERMSDLINDVLNFSKVLDASVFKQVDLNATLKNVVDDFDLLVEQKKAIITQDRLPLIRGVPLQMNQLFYNLLGNALKFSTPDTPPVISISYKMLTQEEVKQFPSLTAAIPYCDITFRDNGIGIEEKFSEQVFVIFARLNSRAHFEGTGIGLALCKRIVLNHKGEIYLLSEKGKGTEFHIILPQSSYSIDTPPK
jgi:two-component system CheB/CheR fusion protein